MVMQEQATYYQALHRLLDLCSTSDEMFPISSQPKKSQDA
jgi:hypothetical protein